MLVHGQKGKGGEKGWVRVITTFLLPIKTNLCLSLKLGRNESQEGKQASVLSG
jgi:hypothetical protein